MNTDNKTKLNYPDPNDYKIVVGPYNIYPGLDLALDTETGYLCYVKCISEYVIELYANSETTLPIQSLFNSEQYPQQDDFYKAYRKMAKAWEYAVKLHNFRSVKPSFIEGLTSSYANQRTIAEQFKLAVEWYKYALIREP